MNVLEEAIAAYQTLLGKDFCLTIGTAQREILKIKFFFLPEHFIHLSGIGKLKDLADINGTKSRKNLYRRLVIMNGTLSSGMTRRESLPRNLISCSWIMPRY